MAGKNGKKRETSTQKTGCPFRVYISYNRKLGKFVVQDCTLNHDHEISEEIFKLIYPQNRKLSPDDEKGMVEDMMIDPNPQLLINKWQDKTGKIILKKDYHNLKYKNATKNVEVAEKVMEVAQKFMANKSNSFEIVKDDQTSTVKIIFIQSAYGKELFDKFSKVIQVDGTYKTNLSKYTLYLVVSLDLCLKTRIIAAGVLRNEDSQTIGEFFEIFKRHNPKHMEIQKVVCDKDYAQIRAIEKHFVHARIILCYYHNLSAIETHVDEPFGKKIKFSTWSGVCRFFRTNPSLRLL